MDRFNMVFSSFYDLDVWKRDRELKLAVYGMIKQFPDSERFELSGQRQWSARSITTNIAEGHGRPTSKDQYNFCVIARGSHSEVLNHLPDAFDGGYISEAELIQLKNQWDGGRQVVKWLYVVPPIANATESQAGWYR